MKELFLQKITLRVFYIAVAFGTSHLIALATSPSFQALQAHAGFSFQISNPDTFKTWLTGGLLVAGEFIYHWIHTKFILPQVTPFKPQDTPPPSDIKPGYGNPA